MSHDSPTSAAALSFWLERQRYDRVIEEGRRLLAQSPEDPDLHRMMAVAHWMLDDRRSAEHHLRQTLRLRPDDESSLSLLALMSSTSMGSRKSDKHAIQALALDPDSVTAWHALASSSLGDDPEFSMRCSRRMLEIDPHNISARILMFAATAIDESVPGWHQQAERWLQEALTIEPENADVHALLGDHLLSVPQRRKEGEAHLRHAIASDPMSAQASAWRRSLASKRDFFLKLLVLPRKICTGIITAMGRSISRYPLLILLGKFYLIAFVFCLMALIFWGIFLWPIVWLYRHYVVQGDHLRASLMLSGKRWLGWLVPAPAWLRRIIMLFPLLAWWRLVPEIIGGIGSLHPGLHSGNVVAIGATVLLLGCAGLYCWLEFRASRRRKEMAGFPPTA